ncbi:MAG: tetratricopeptide repeat protein [Sphingomonadales bacterium]|nr:tetratricopeptide repeat protein [Sphingomonadales bacterium]
MTWAVILAVALAVFGALVFVFKLPRVGWELAAAALLFGISGYAMQGHPAEPGAPKPPSEDSRSGDAALLKAREAMGNSSGEGGRWMILADSFARNGQFRAAAEMLGNAVKQNPNDADLWVALGNALVEHSDGMITPAAQFAFQKAARIDPTHPGPPFFMGLALAQSGRLADARAVWQQLLDRSPPGAAWRDDLEARIARIDQMMAARGGAAAPSGN